MISTNYQQKIEKLLLATDIFELSIYITVN